MNEATMPRPALLEQTSSPAPDWIRLRDGSLINAHHLSILAQQPVKGSYVYQGNDRVRTEQDAESIAAGLGATWSMVPCVVARRGTNQGIDYRIWTRPGDVKRIMLHSSGQYSLLVHATGKIMVTPLKPAEVQRLLEGGEAQITVRPSLEILSADPVSGLGEALL